MYVGDWVRLELLPSKSGSRPKGWEARLRTNLGRDGLLRQEILNAGFEDAPVAGASWRDIPMKCEEDRWVLVLPLVEPGWFQFKAYALDPEGFQHWPDGDNAGISVHPDELRIGNTIYCAFPRMFGGSRFQRSTEDEGREAWMKELDAQGYTVIPPSGTLRDVVRQLPHISGTLGCRYLHLLPINSTPTTLARFGRYGSPYACQDLTDIDPALVEFDKKATGVEQFRELTEASHDHGMKVILDVVINHTGWGSTLYEEHPEWFKRADDGEFESPGAWGTVWEDLVELDQQHPPLWRELAEVFLVWLRRGVDGFRCDAGYKVPMHVWRFITARVREEFPNALFLLEGLGGAWEDTANLLKAGGMQWAYSELFQEYSGEQVYRYLNHALERSHADGTLINYSETHDNLRLAMQGRDWSLHRNRLCALTSISGGFGFTCGVEWLADERVNVHSCRGLNWDSEDNIVQELSVLNQLISNHPCFFDGAELKILSDDWSDVLMILRTSADGESKVLVLANTHQDESRGICVSDTDFDWENASELLGQDPLHWTRAGDGLGEIEIPALGCCCFGVVSDLEGAGQDYRNARSRAAWGLWAARQELSLTNLGHCDWQELEQLVDRSPEAFLGALPHVDTSIARQSLVDGVCAAIGHVAVPKLVRWSRLDLMRITPVPPDHWVLIEDHVHFLFKLEDADGKVLHGESIFAGGRHVAAIAPHLFHGLAAIDLRRSSGEERHGKGELLFLSSEARPMPSEKALERPWEKMVLMTNGIGGMARISVDLGHVRSKYDCVLGANLHDSVPVDRHVFAKRIRVWVNADGFISALNGSNLRSFGQGPVSTWLFDANAGDGRVVEIKMEMWMEPGKNTTRFRFSRGPFALPRHKMLAPNCKVSLTVRLDLEDRNFHTHTRMDGGADSHFRNSSEMLEKGVGFTFQPADDRCVVVVSNAGRYHAEAEWALGIQHPVEQTRGHEGSGDAFSPGWHELPLESGQEAQLVVSAEAFESPASFFEEPVVPVADKLSLDDPFGDSLKRAVGDYVVRRDDVKTVIAGYPWFLDWGRDSLIAARGMLAAGMRKEVLDLLVAFGRFEEDGTLPNTIHGEDASNRDTSDAPLWYGIVCEDYAADLDAKEKKAFFKTKVTKDKTISDVLLNIAHGYRTGTPNGIHMDVDSGLIWSPSHFTWMDTNFPAGTPRTGYPVEIQAMWIRLLRLVGELSGMKAGTEWIKLAHQALESVEELFWLEDKGWYADCLSAAADQSANRAGVEDCLRSNCLYLISLGLVSDERARRTVEAARRYLIIPGAIRSLAPLPVEHALPVRSNGGDLLNNPSWPYWGRYEGDEDTRRKPAYHNGTAWTWPFPTFCEALALAYENSADARSAARHYLGSMTGMIEEGCVGQVPEVLDGDAPHSQRGCDAQAWGATEALRVWRWLSD